MIRLFITDFANKNAALLIADRKGMEKRKEELAVIHPLKHIAFVWTDPELSQSMGIIKKTRFKWTRYLKGMARALKRHKLAGTLNEYVPGFADFLEADRSIIQKHLDRDNYRELFEYLFQLETYKKNVS